MQYLRKNTATRVTVGPFFDKTDGVTPETSLTVTNCKLTFIVDDGGVPTLILDTNPTASGGDNDMVHITGDDAGYYDLELTAANVNYLGRAKLALTDAANHCPVFHEFMIIPEEIYDAMILGTDLLQVDLTQIGGDAQSATDLKDFADSGYDPTTNKVQGVVLTDTVTTYTGNTPQTGDAFARLGAPAGASVSADIAGVKTQTAAIEVNTADIQSRIPSALGANGNIKADLRDSVGVALATATNGHVPSDIRRISGSSAAVTNFQAMYDGTGYAGGTIKMSINETNLALEATLTSIKGATFDPSTDSLESIRNRGDAAWITATGFSTLDAADVRSAVGLASANLDTQLAAIDTNTGNILANLATVDTAVSNIESQTAQMSFTGGAVDSNMVAISGSTSSADRLERSTLGIVLGTVGAAASTTSIPTSSLSPSPADADQMKGRIVTFDANTTTAGLRGQSTDITNMTSGGVLTVTALTTAPASGDTFVIT